MHTDDALAASLAVAIKQRGWTDREVARRMTEAGHPMAHPAVIRARKGERTISVREWLTFAHVLSVAPLALLGPSDGEGVEVAGAIYSVDEVARWLGGQKPLSGVDNAGHYYATAGGMKAPSGSHFTSSLRALADHFDTSDNDNERRSLLVQVAAAAIDRMRADDRTARNPRDPHRTVRIPRDTPERGEGRKGR